VNIIQRQLGHTDLGTTSTYLQGIDPSELLLLLAGSRFERTSSLTPASVRTRYLVWGGNGAIRFVP
jgi:integrase